jgi:hypothetical protein
LSYPGIFYPDLIILSPEKWQYATKKRTAHKGSKLFLLVSSSKSKIVFWVCTAVTRECVAKQISPAQGGITLHVRSESKMTLDPPFMTSV